MPDLPPSHTPGVLLYRCRRCSTEYRAYPVQDAPGTLVAVIKAYGRLVAGADDPAKLALAQPHACPDGRWGIGDIVGMSTAASDGMPAT